VLATFDDVAGYLLSRGWVGADVVVAGDLELSDASRRNANFTVVSSHGPSYFLKQETRARHGRVGDFGSVAYEAIVYELLTNAGRHGDGFPWLPRCHAFDPDERLLVLEALAGWTTLTEYQLRRRHVSEPVAAGLAHALADLHGLTPDVRERIVRATGAPDDPPWVFFLTEPDHVLSVHSSLATLELLRIVQQSDELAGAFERLRRQWRNTAFIHGDLKWDNCLVPPRANSRSAPQLKIVDWELARSGDPCWDLAAVFSGHLTAWLESIPISGDDPPDRFLAHARFPLESMHPALRTFWRVYCERMELSGANAGESLVRATAFAGVRLVQTAFEHAQADPELGTTAVFLLQLCANIAARPVEAAVQLLRLPLPDQAHADAVLR
jgi:aminoglycoside phosphotransferase (APT) family kinase protein